MMNAVILAVAAVMVPTKFRTMATLAMALVMAALVARMTAVTAAVMANLHLEPNCFYNPPSTSTAIIVTVT
jgi:hypothetical protein